VSAPEISPASSAAPSPPNRPRLHRRALLLGGTGLAAASLAGCGGSAPQADLALIYNPAAQHHGIDRNPIIVIPGLLGSRLRDPASGRIVWGAFDGNAADPRTADGARLVALPFTDMMMTPGSAVAADGVLDRVRIRVAGIPIALQAYAGILGTLGVGGYVDESLGLGGQVDYGNEHFTCFQFAYDWRQDNAANARRLMAFMREKRALVQREHLRRYGVRDSVVKFDIAAHSMGGIVARYALMYGDADLPADGSLPPLTWAGSEMIARLIQIATPNGGSLDAFRVLVDGRDFGAPIVPRYSPAILGTMPSLYQLLPRPRARPVVVAGATGTAVDLLDPEVWQRMGWGIANAGIDADLAQLMPDVGSAAERRRIALALQARLLRRARAFSAAMDRPGTTPAGSELMVVAGDAMPTTERYAANPRDGSITPLTTAPGDGLVLRDSTLLDMRQGQDQSMRGPFVVSPMDFRRTLFLPGEHLDITRDPTFRNNVLFWLLEEPRRNAPVRTAGTTAPAPPRR
jgi:hypothetical protein